MSAPSRLLVRRFRWSVLLLAVVPAVSSAAAAVRQTSGVLSKGTAWETLYYVQQSDRPGPTVIIVGGVHGDEPAGAAAADEIRHWPILRGTLAVLPRANPPGLAAHKRLMPGVAKADANLNRNFPKAGHPGPATGVPAQAIWAWVQARGLSQFSSDENGTVPLRNGLWLIDLHEGSGVRAAGSKSVGSSAIVFPSAEADTAARLMVEAVNATIKDEKKRFVHLKMPVDGSLARAAGAHLGARAMILETSINDPSAAAAVQAKGKAKAKASANTKPKPQPLSRRVRQHRIMVFTLLKHLGMIDPALNLDQLSGRDATPDKTWAALYDAGGTGGKGPVAAERILTAAGMGVRRVGPEELAAGTLAHFDLVLVPGGSGSKQSAAIGDEGRRQIRKFVADGGGYIGICAGAYLCTSGFDWGLKILDAKTVSPHWQRGTGTVKIELTPAGQTILGERPGLLDVHYANGPVITRAHTDGLAEYEVLAYFRTELAGHGAPAGAMANSPAIAAGRCGKGRVVFISPHPEQTPGLEDFVRRAALWAVGKM